MHALLPMQAKKKQYVQRLNALTPPMRYVAARHSSAAAENDSISKQQEAFASPPMGASTQPLLHQHDCISTELQRLLPSSLLMPERHLELDADIEQSIPSPGAALAQQPFPAPNTPPPPSSRTENHDHDRAWVALQGILTLPDSITGGHPVTPNLNLMIHVCHKRLQPLKCRM